MSNDSEELWSIWKELRDRNAVMECADNIFDLMERLDNLDLGLPGPLVHALRQLVPEADPI